MADSKVTQMTERVGAILGTDLMMIVGNTVSSPTNYRVQVKNFISNIAVDFPATTLSAFKIVANVAANGVAATLIGAEFGLQSNAASGFTTRDRVGLLIRNEIAGANSNVTGQMWGGHVKLDPGTSNFVAANAFGMVIEHTIANTAQARLVSPRAYLAIKENAGTSGNATSFLFDIGAQGNTVTQNVTDGNSAVVFSRANNYVLVDINRTLKCVVNGETLWILASNVVPDNT